MKTNFPNPEDLLNFELTITPDDGKPSHLACGCSFVWSEEVGAHVGPLVVYHVLCLRDLSP